MAALPDLVEPGHAVAGNPSSLRLISQTLHPAAAQPDLTEPGRAADGNALSQVSWLRRLQIMMGDQGIYRRRWVEVCSLGFGC